MSEDLTKYRVLSDNTGQEILAEMKTMGANLKTIAESTIGTRSQQEIDTIFAAMLDDTNTTDIFRKWYAIVQDGEQDRYALLERFFTMCAMNNDQQHTVRFYSAAASSSDDGTPLDWLADKSPAALATDTDDGGEDWAAENRMTWYIRANAISLADGTMNVLAIEGETDFDITGELAPVYTFQMAQWYKEEFTANYEQYSWRATRAAGYEPFFGDVAPDGTKRAMTWHATFPGGLTADGKLTSGAGRRAVNFTSTTTGLTDARKWTGGYEGTWTDCDTLFVLREWQHRHFSKENSGICEGCTNYNHQYAVALTEENTMRVLVTTAQGANFIVGSCVIVGDRGESTNNDRGQAHMRNLSSHSVEILEKNDVTIGDAQYTELVLNLDAPITTTATTYVSTMPWNSGETEKLPDRRDGSPVNLTNGKYPMRVAGIEMLPGAYATGLDPLYQVTANEEGGYDYVVYECTDSEKQAGSVTENYVATGITAEGIISGWQYVKEFVKTDKPILFPLQFGGSSNGHYKSGFCGTLSAGVRLPARFGSLDHGGRAGLACCFAYAGPSWTYWGCAPRLAGAGKKRGEWAA